MRGIGDPVQITETAYFDFYLPGSLHGKNIFAHYSIVADVMPSLAPNLLLGNNFLVPARAVLDMGEGSITFNSAHGMVTQGEVIRRPPRWTNKTVTCAQHTKIPPGVSALVSVKWSSPDALDDTEGELQPFHFESSHSACPDLTLNHKCPKQLLVCNYSDSQPICLSRNETLGQLVCYRGNEEESYIASGSRFPLQGMTEFDSLEDVESFVRQQALMQKTGQEDQVYLAQDQEPAASKPDSDLPTVDEGIPNYGISKPEDVP
ncbi:hypothetical protein F5883DRAFT_435051, partial [Diaporthe sp. PMI_573]